MAARKWKSMVNKALNNSTTKSVPTEWKKFTEIKINFLQELRNSNSVQDLDDNYDVYQLCFQDEEFVKRCLLVSLENSLVQFTMVIFSYICIPEKIRFYFLSTIAGSKSWGIFLNKTHNLILFSPKNLYLHYCTK